MQNKPNFRNVQMAVSLVKTMTNNNEQRTMNYSKQTQSNPTCSELVEPISKWCKPCLAAGMIPEVSLQFDGPVGVVEELLPTTVAGLAEMNVDKRIVFRSGGLLDEGHSGLLGSSASLYDVTFCAGANHIFPIRFSAHTARDNVVERQFAGRISLATILTSVFVASEDISSIEFDLVSRQTVVK